MNNYFNYTTITLLTYQSINQSVNQSINQSISQCLSSKATTRLNSQHTVTDVYIWYVGVA